MAYIRFKINEYSNYEFIIRVEDKYVEEAKANIKEVIANCKATGQDDWDDYYTNINECVVNNFDGEIIDIDSEIYIYE